MFLLKQLHFIRSFKIWWSMAVFIIKAELLNVVLSSLIECQLDDVTLTSKLSHSCYDDRSCRHLYRSMADSVCHAPPIIQ